MTKSRGGFSFSIAAQTFVVFHKLLTGPAAPAVVLLGTFRHLTIVGTPPIPHPARVTLLLRAEARVCGPRHVLADHFVAGIRLLLSLLRRQRRHSKKNHRDCQAG